jgi:hypothetical protein
MIAFLESLQLLFEEFVLLAEGWILAMKIEIRWLVFIGFLLPILIISVNIVVDDLFFRAIVFGFRFNLLIFFHFGIFVQICFSAIVQDRCFGIALSIVSID